MKLANDQCVNTCDWCAIAEHVGTDDDIGNFLLYGYDLNQV